MRTKKISNELQTATILFLAILTLLYSCKKSVNENSVNHDRDPKFNNSGFYYILATDIKRYDYPGGSKMIASGYYYKDQKTDMVNVNPNIYDDKGSYEIRNIAISQDSTLYINYSDKKTMGYIKVINNIPQQPHVIVQNNTDSDNRLLKLGGLAVNGNDVYFSGAEYSIDSGFIWKNDDIIANYYQDILFFTNGKLYTAGTTFYTVDGNKHNIDQEIGATTYVKKMVIDNNNVYILGYLHNRANNVNKYVYWKNGSISNISSTNRGVFDIAVKNGSVYLAGVINQTDDFCIVGLWKDNLEITRDTFYSKSVYGPTLYGLPITVKDMNISNDSIYTLYEEIQPDIAYDPAPTIKFYKGDSLIFTNYTPSTNPSYPEGGSGFGNAIMSLIR